MTNTIEEYCYEISCRGAPDTFMVLAPGIVAAAQKAEQMRERSTPLHSIIVRGRAYR